MKGEVYGKRELSPLVGLNLVSKKRRINKEEDKYVITKRQKYRKMQEAE